MDIQEKSVQKFLYTQDIKLAAVLYALGCPQHRDLPLQRFAKQGQPEVVIFNFEESDECKDYIKAWDQSEDCYGKPDHQLYNPEHPFWYMRAAMRNRERILDAVKRQGVLVSFVKDGKTYLKMYNGK